MRPSSTLGFVLATAFLLRVAVVLYVLTHFGPAWFFDRGSEMGFIAKALLNHQGFSSPFGTPTGPTALVAPGYPLLVAAIFAAFGTYTWTAALVMMLLNIFCNTAAVYLIAQVASTFASQRAACRMAMFWACSMPLLWMPSIFWETSLSSLLVLVLVTILRLTSDQRPWHFWLASGVLSGVAGLLNPALLGAFLVVLVATLIRTSSEQSHWKLLACYAIGLALVFSPWPIRNSRVLHAWVLTRTTVGFELWMGNHQGNEGFLDCSLFPTYNAAELSQYRREGELLYMADKEQLARSFIQAHPGRFVLLSGHRFLRFWTGTGTQGGSCLFCIQSLVSTCLGLSGWMLLWRRGQKSLCLSAALVLLLFPLPYYITHAEFRYRLVVDPILCALAAPALEQISLKLKSFSEASTPATVRLQS